MNYYNPYIGGFPSYSAPAATGIFSKLAGGGGIKWGSILTGAQKVLGIANQAIPVIKQVTPVVKNAKTMFKVMNEFKKVDTPSSNVETKTDIVQTVDNTEVKKVNDDGPTFFI